MLGYKNIGFKNMRSKLNLFKPVQKSFTLIKEIHAVHKPDFFSGLFSGNKWRHESMGKTVNYVTDPIHYHALQNHMEVNIAQWTENKLSSPSIVEVVCQDWGLATLKATKTYGVIYAVLNMANSLYPGGAVLEGGSAQEENMWHRSTCIRSLLDEGVYLNQETNTFQYNRYKRNLIEAKAIMTNKELHVLNENHKQHLSPKYKVLISAEPRICFRGPEIHLPSDMDSFGSGIPTSDADLSYAFLPTSEIFPFYELRSAAPEFVTNTQRSQYGSEEEYKMDLRRRIAAQLDTLILARKAHVILGAWGCGAFHNDPQIVAQIYREEIEKRSAFFQHILFPIINIGSHNNNYHIFEEYLTDIKLGDTCSVKHGIKF